MFKFSAVSQIWKKYIQKLNDWDLPLKWWNSSKTWTVRVPHASMIEHATGYENELEFTRFDFVAVRTSLFQHTSFNFVNLNA